MFYINTIKKLKEENAALAERVKELEDRVSEEELTIDGLTLDVINIEGAQKKQETQSSEYLEAFLELSKTIDELTIVQSALVGTHHNRALLDGTLNPKKK